MFGAFDSRRASVAFCGLMATVALVLPTGCAMVEGPPAGPVQVQFYAPHGARIVLRDYQDSQAEIRERGPLDDRLEYEREEYAVYDLTPGRYQFAYMSAPGAEDAAIYGELEIRSPDEKDARMFCTHSFIPIRLPSAAHQEGEHLFPSRDLSYTEGLEEREFDHLKQGDLIEQVYFVADLERTKREYEIDYFQAINDIDRALSVLADREEYLMVRYDDARRRAMFRNPDVNIEDQVAHERFDVLGIEEPFIALAKKRKALEREREGLNIDRRMLEEERARRNALLRSMRIVHRSGAVVLATPDLKIPFTDSVEQASDLGEVLAIVRVGGRHQYWAWGVAGE